MNKLVSEWSKYTRVFCSTVKQFHCSVVEDKQKQIFTHNTTKCDLTLGEQMLLSSYLSIYLRGRPWKHCVIVAGHQDEAFYARCFMMNWWWIYWHGDGGAVLKGQDNHPQHIHLNELWLLITNTCLWLTGQQWGTWGLRPQWDSGTVFMWNLCYHGYWEKVVCGTKTLVGHFSLLFLFSSSCAD